ncbi:uncharacterized protein DUF4307 [Flavimobilis soli]|jgi:hypothetical protein|uniref:Uncharacterized protein DUF4307 n=1 Tax=Flavimobilis soli TaxID=442709 RepID=A0A2A9EF35_9MICO|nr:DUF4307 domain-containing protein [Flavimobilis soli]PFG37538.1 uncharacterized protein DUF4307 [Flavimobilis soli]
MSETSPSGPSTDPAPAPLAERYGTVAPDARARRLRVAALWTIGVVGTVLAAWSGWSMVASEKFTTQDVGFSVQSSEVVTVTFNVTKDADLTLDCRVVALNTAYGQVGYRDVTIGPGTSERETFTVEVRTSELATTGMVDSCTAR